MVIWGGTPEEIAKYLHEFAAIVTAAANNVTGLPAEPATPMITAAAIPEIDLAKLVMTNGYVGRMGQEWKTPTCETFELAVAGAMKHNAMTRQQVIDALASGKRLDWGRSPNHYYDHSMAVIGTRRVVREEKMKLCECGHEVPESQVMSASLGTSCSDCYDRMS